MTRKCELWPRCDCYSQLTAYGWALQDEHRVWDVEDLVVVEDMIFICLCCVERRCPDRAIREFAKRQLRHEFWAEQKARSIYWEQ
jgi:hypothetical protein